MIVKNLFCMKHIFFAVFIIISFLSMGQMVDSMSNQNMRLIHKNHLGFSLGGPGYLGYYYEHYFNQNWSIEIGLGSVLVLTGAYAEARYYFGNKHKQQKVTPYVGLAGGATMILGLDDSYGTPIVYAPVGLQIFSKKGFAFSFEAAYFRFDGETFPMGSIRFRLMKKERKNRNK